MGSVPDTQLFRDVFTASPIGIAVENLDGQLLFVNPAFCSMLGFSEEDLRSKHCVDFSPREDAEKDGAVSAIARRLDRPLPIRETLFSTGWLVDLGAIECLFVGEHPSVDCCHG